MLHFRAFSLAFFYLAVFSVFCFCPVFHKASFNSECFLLELVFFHTPFLYPALLVVLFWVAIPSVSLLLVCFSGVVHMSQPVAGVISHTNVNSW